jgi:hypothetical protein
MRSRACQYSTSLSVSPLILSRFSVTVTGQPSLFAIRWKLIADCVIHCHQFHIRTYREQREMTNRGKIEDRIEKKEQEIQELEMRIREARAYIQALQDVAKLMPREGAVGDLESNSDSSPRAGSYIADAKDSILKAGRPLHVVEIIKMSGRKNDRKTRTGISGSLAAYVRRGDTFTRPRPNTFSLLELERNTSAQAAAPATSPSQPTVLSGARRPPVNFGLDDSDTNH